MIDWNRVAELRDEVGAEDLDEVVEIFLEEVEEVIARLKATPDIARYEEDLHFLKGSALNLGFVAFSDLCQDGEKAAANGQAEEIEMADVFRVYAASKTEFLAKRGNMGQAA